MRVDALAIALRPRPMAEAADLGQRLVQKHALSVWLSFAPPWLAVVLLALATVEIAAWLPNVVIFMAKPWLDRTLLFVHSRAAFGEPTRWSDVWAARGTVFWRRWWSSLTMARLSPWRAFTAPITQLEGQRGAAWRKRRAVMLSGRRGPALALQFVYGNLEWILIAGIVALAGWFLPDALAGELWRQWTEDEAGLALTAAVTVAYGAVVLALEPFYVAAGFAMYLNRRVELEAWDIEQEFRHAFA